MKKVVTVSSINPPRSFFVTAVRIILVFHLVLLAWIFFRAENMHNAINIIRGILSFNPQHHALPGEQARLHVWGIAFKAIFVDSLFAAHGWMRKLPCRVTAVPYTAKLLIFAFLTAMILLLGNRGELEFIYFQFRMTELRKIILNSLLLLTTTTGFYLGMMWCLHQFHLHGRRALLWAAPYLQRKGGHETLLFNDFEKYRPYNIVVIGSSHA